MHRHLHQQLHLQPLKMLPLMSSQEKTQVRSYSGKKLNKRGKNDEDLLFFLIVHEGPRRAKSA